MITANRMNEFERGLSNLESTQFGVHEN